tara:strand:- start:29 stop:190 length:162 start_codon:yes stop_codon:yes gene_type:complete
MKVFIPDKNRAVLEKVVTELYLISNTIGTRNDSSVKDRILAVRKKINQLLGED